MWEGEEGCVRSYRKGQQPPVHVLRWVGDQYFRYTSRTNLKQRDILKVGGCRTSSTQLKMCVSLQEAIKKMNKVSTHWTKIPKVAISTTTTTTTAATMTDHHPSIHSSIHLCKSKNKNQNNTRNNKYHKFKSLDNSICSTSLKGYIDISKMDPILT